MPEEIVKQCNGSCKQVLSLNEFQFRTDSLTYRNVCKNCTKNVRSKHYSDNRNKILKQSKNYYENNKEKKQTARNKNKATRSLKDKEKWKSNYNFRLRQMLSKSIRKALKNEGKSKSCISILDKLEYSMDELTMHLSSKFENWMNWNNWGRYDPENWNDNDQSTWTWQLDHIIPHSTFKYKSMDDENFKICWSLDNLRPYSAKQNILDGCTLIRHAKVNND